MREQTDEERRLIIEGFRSYRFRPVMLPQLSEGKMPMETDPRVTALVEAKAELIAYLLMKVRAADWHAVADAACDLREVEAMLKVANA